MTAQLKAPGGAPIPLPTERVGLFNPPADLARLREEEPVRRLVYPSGEVGWLVTDYELGRAVLGDQRFGKGIDDPQMHDPPVVAEVNERMKAAGDPAMMAMRAGNFLQMDPPEHTRFRRLLAPYFTMSSLRAELGSVVQDIVDERLRAMEEAGPPVEFVTTFAEAVPLRTICHMLGVPESGRATVRAFADGALAERVDGDEVAAATRATGELMRELVARRHAEPGEDLVSRMVVSGVLEDHEIVGVSMILAGAGFHTTSTMLANGTFALLCERERWERLVAEPDLVERASEELLRYLTVNQLDAHTRTAREDVEIAGVLVKTGEHVHVSLPAVNRDPKRFEDPDALDVERDARGQLTLGHGIHICLGQHLARLEMYVAFRGLLARFPTLRLAVPVDEVPMPPGSAPLYSPYELPVAW